MRKTLLLLIVVLAAIALISSKIDFQTYFDMLLRYVEIHSPLAASILRFAGMHIAAADLLGIAIFSFAARLFFVPIPGEPYILYAFALGTNPILLGLIVAIAGTAASVINYLAGALLHKHVMKGKEASKIAEETQKYRFTGLAVFLASVLPVPDITGLVFGALRAGVKKYAIYTFTGLLIKTYLTILLADYAGTLLASVL